MVNGDRPPRVPRELKRRLRAAIHNLAQGKPSPVGDSLSTLMGCAAYVYMTDPALGEKYLAALGRSTEPEPAPRTNGDEATGARLGPPLRMGRLASRTRDREAGVRGTTRPPDDPIRPTTSSPPLHFSRPRRSSTMPRSLGFDLHDGRSSHLT